MPRQAPGVFLIARRQLKVGFGCFRARSGEKEL